MVKRLPGPGSRAAVIALLLSMLGAFRFTYPLACSFMTAVPGQPGDNFEYLYEIWWVKHALTERSLASFGFGPNVFYPFGYQIFASRHHCLFMSLLALPVTLSVGEGLAYNLLVILSYALSGLGAWLLAYHLTHNRVAAWVAGSIFAFSPYRSFHMNTGHLPVFQTQWLPFAFLYLDRTLRGWRWRDSLWAGLFYSLSVLSSWYYGYMLTLLLLLYVVHALLVGRWRVGYWPSPRQRGICLLAFVLVVALLLGAFVAQSARAQISRLASLSPIQAEGVGASIADFFVPNLYHPVWGRMLVDYYRADMHENVLSLGWVALSLGIAAWCMGRGRGLGGMAVIGITSFVLALGLTLHYRGEVLYIPAPAALVDGFTRAMGIPSGPLSLNPWPYWRLWHEGAVYIPLPALLVRLFLPFADAVRYWSRFGAFASLAMAVWAGAGAEGVLSWLAQRFKQRANATTIRKWGAIALVACVLFEFLAAPLPFGLSQVHPTPLDEWLRAQEGDFAVMRYPLDEAMWGFTLYGARVHGKKILYGYGGQFPKDFIQDLSLLALFPRAEGIAFLRYRGVRYVVVHVEGYGQAWSWVKPAIEEHPEVVPVVTIQQPFVARGDRLFADLTGVVLPEQETFIVYEIR